MTYANHFGAYRKILCRLLDHDPSMFMLPRDSRIADIGCGYGDLLRTLHGRGYTNLLGVEPDPVCRARAHFDVSPGTIEATGLDRESIDAVIVNNVFHHVGDYGAAIAELSRVLKPGGVLCFIEPLDTVWRLGMDFLTFETPLRFLPGVSARHSVMSLEMETGLYPKWLREQAEFHRDVSERFERLWLKPGWLFQFGKYCKHQL